LSAFSHQLFTITQSTYIAVIRNYLKLNILTAERAEIAKKHSKLSAKKTGICFSGVPEFQINFYSALAW